MDKWEATIKALESLVRKNPEATREVKQYELNAQWAAVQDYPFALVRRLNMATEQQARLMCTWI